MTAELHFLAASIVLGLAQLVASAALPARQYGMQWAFGPRDESVKALTSKVAGRLLRAWRNFLETFPLFAAAVVVVQLTDLHTPMTVLGAQLYFWSRLAYVPAYAAGVPVVRTLIWAASIAGIILVIGAAL